MPSRPPAKNQLEALSMEDRIQELRKYRIPTFSGPEKLDKPLDTGIQIAPESSEWMNARKIQVLADGEPLSWLWVVDFQQQIGARQVRMGGIAGVGTPENHRFKGYSRLVIDNSLRWMRDQGFDTSMLYGIPSFYPKFGYAEAFPSVTFSMNVRYAAVAPAKGIRVLQFRPEHLRPVLRIYHRYNLNRTGCTLRRVGEWPVFRKGSGYLVKAVCKVVLNQSGRLIGYLVYDDAKDRVLVTEVGLAHLDACPAILAHLVRLATRQGLENIRFLLPDDDEFMHFCCPMGIHKEVLYRPDGGGMVRLVNVRSTLSKVADELATRMGQPGAINLRTNLGGANLRWSGGEMEVGQEKHRGPSARLPQWALAQMLYGYRSVRLLTAEGVLHTSRQGRDILEEMFPVRPHYQYAADHF